MKHLVRVTEEAPLTGRKSEHRYITDDDPVWKLLNFHPTHPLQSQNISVAVTRKDGRTLRYEKLPTLEAIISEFLRSNQSLVSPRTTGLLAASLARHIGQTKTEETYEYS